VGALKTLAGAESKEIASLGIMWKKKTIEDLVEEIIQKAAWKISK
jgi:hypothetical protein